MTVLLPNARLGLRRRVDGTRNAHGERTPAGWGDITGPYDGRVNEQAGGTWALGLDPRLWPVRANDIAIAGTGQSWLITGADLIQNNYDATVDWIRATALHRTDGGTEPGGVWFVARYTTFANPVPDAGAPAPRKESAALWVGYGPPPAPSPLFTPEPYEEYLDLTTGTIYTYTTA